MTQRNKFTRISILLLVICCISTMVFADETKWLAVGMLHDWFSSMGCEVEVGRRHLVSDQQDGLRWPAQFNWQDCKAAKALWIGAKNYYDPLVNKTFDYKVVHVGPRVSDEKNESIPVIFKLLAGWPGRGASVQGILSCLWYYLDFFYEVD
ncbi:MAG: hypothetical protein ONB13_01615, partial [candidate division KSB1 bacterium]|nr:hypothetical protein [candidate division KSB1 bacterium]